MATPGSRRHRAVAGANTPAKAARRAIHATAGAAPTGASAAAGEPPSRPSETPASTSTGNPPALTSAPLRVQQATARMFDLGAVELYALVNGAGLLITADRHQELDLGDWVLARFVSYNVGQRACLMTVIPNQPTGPEAIE